MNIDGLILFLLGACILAGAVLDWEWLMGSRKARFFVELLGGRTTARIFYALVSIGLLTIVLLGAAGIINLGE